MFDPPRLGIMELGVNFTLHPPLVKEQSKKIDLDKGKIKKSKLII